MSYVKGSGMMRRSVWSMWFMAMGVLAASASNRIDEIAAWLPERPVPVVAGKLQRKGRAAAAKVLKADFTDDCDTLVLDCTAAYDVPALKSLVRTVAFDRKSGLIAVSDAVSN